MSKKGVTILLLLLVLVFASVSVNAVVNLESPVNESWTNLNNDSVAFEFNITAANGLIGPVSCNLTLQGAVVATNNSMVNDTTTTLYSNTSFVVGTNTWFVKCGNTTHTNQSAPNLFHYDPVAPTVEVLEDNNTNETTAPYGILMNVTDNLGGPYSCALIVNGVLNTTNTSTENNTETDLNFDASEGTYTYYVNCTDNASNWGVSPLYDFTFDFNNPTITYFAFGGADTYVSDAVVNNQIVLYVNATDAAGTGIEYITVNLTDLSGDVSNSDYENMTYDEGGNNLWNLTITVTDSSTWDFENANVSVVAYDYVGKPHTTGQDFDLFTVYNMTYPPMDDPCLQFTTGTTNFSTETDFTSVDFTVVVQWLYNIGCGYYGPFADSSYHTVAKINFSGLNMSDSATVQKLSGLEDALDVIIAPENTFGTSRVYLNTTFFAELDEPATVELYDLPFDGEPDITGDPGSAGYNAGSVVYTTYTHPIYGNVGNLTFNVLGFSGYNVSDTVNPLITVNTPWPNLTYVQGPTTVINVTANGTGTQISNFTIVLDGTINYMDNMTCYNATGSEEMNCYFTTGALLDGVHQIVVNVWDYGGAAPGLFNTTTVNFTVDSSAPTVSNNQSNITGVISPTDSVLLNLTATDLTNVTSVTANGVTMGNHTEDDYNLTTTPTALGCTSSGSCVVTFNATDYWGHSNTNYVTVFTVDAGAPAVTGVSVTNATNVTSATVVNIQATAVDPSGVVSVTANGVTMYNFAGNVWTANLTAGALSCSSDATCTITINATDATSNYNDTETTSYYVDDTAPAVATITRSPTEVQLAGTVRVNATVTDGSAIGSVTVNGTSMTIQSGNIYGTAGVTPASLGCSGNSNCSLAVTATDVPGNSNNTETTWIMVDNAAPTTTFVYNSTNLSRSTTAITLNVTVVESNTISSVTVNSAYALTQIGSTTTWYITDTPANMGCSTEGVCNMVFSATDVAGNVGTDSMTLRVDDTGPAVTGGNVNVTTAKNTTTVRVRVTVVDAVTPTVSGVSAKGQAMTDMGSNLWEVNASGQTFGCGPDGVCTLTFVATDGLGNVNGTETTTYTIDSAAPSNSTAFSASTSSSGATLSATMTESAICTVSYGTNTSVLGSSTSSAALSSTGAISIAGLSASTTYYYNVTQCQDGAGNVNFNIGGAVQNFTTSATSTTPNGGGGGGGGSSSSLSYEAGDITASTGNWLMARGDKMVFTHEEGEYTLKVLGIGRTYARIQVNGYGEDQLGLTQSKAYDLDGDSKADIDVTLMELRYGKADLRVVSLVSSTPRAVTSVLPPGSVVRGERPAAEELSETGEAEAGKDVESAPAEPEEDKGVMKSKPVTDTLGEEITQESGKSLWWLWSLLLAIVVAIVGFIIYKRKNS